MPRTRFTSSAASSSSRACLPFLLRERVEGEDEGNRLVCLGDRPIGRVLAVAARQRERATAIDEWHLDRLDAGQRGRRHRDDARRVAVRIDQRDPPCGHVDARKLIRTLWLLL